MTVTGPVAAAKPRELGVRVSRRPIGFTLTELLIVMAVLSLLLILMAPGISRATALARRAQCAGRLRAITDAYHLRRNTTVHSAAKPFDVHNQWPGQLREQVSGHSSAFRCPSDPDPRPFTELPVLERKWFGQEDSRTDLDLFASEPVWEEMSLAEASPQPGVWKVNEQVFADLVLDQGTNQVANLPPYTPGSNPNVCYMLVDDEGSGGDRDFEDLVFRIESEPDGTLIITCVGKGVTVHDHDLIGPFLTAPNVSTGAGPFTFPARGPLSYGMTMHANRERFQGRTVLVLDYLDDVVMPGVQTNDVSWATLQAPRHLDRCNVAFASGDVEALRPEEIDPNVDALRQRLWDPISPDP